MIYITLLNIAIFQGLILGLIILRSPLFSSAANKYLAYAIFTLSILLLNLVLEMGGAYESMPFLHFIDDVEWAFVLPVFIFLFIIKKTDHALQYNRKVLLLFIPFGYSAALNIISDCDTIAGFYTIPPLGLQIIDVLSQVELFLALTFIPCIILYAYTFIKHATDQYEKRWLTSLWLIIAVLLFSWVIAVIAGLFFSYDISSLMRSLALFGTLLIHWSAYIGIYKYKLAKDKAAIYSFLNQELVVSFDNVSIPDNSIREEIKESITADNLYFQKLEALCKEHHIYTDSTLSRERVAEQLGISPGYVSQIVNIVTGDNFANYINSYRVKAVQEMILSADFENYNLLTIGLESGFTSKTTFYNAFKKITGQTPNEYRNANK